jgi:hypothetical protein
MKFVRIEKAFSACKQRIKEGFSELSIPPTLKVAAERISRLERENERLKQENRHLLEQFVVWQYNAHIHGLDERELNRALPGIDRGRTD